jgi:hypothetical protein
VRAGTLPRRDRVEKTSNAVFVTPARVQLPALVAKVERLRAIQQAAPSAVRLREPAPMPDHIDRFASTEDPNAALSRDELRRGITTLANAVESTRCAVGEGSR